MSKIELGISKFKNDNGISCYINSILHILQQLPYFADYIILEQYVNDIQDKQLNYDTILSHALFKILKLSYENDNINITPVTFKKILAKLNPIWGEQVQQDSQEFLIFILSQLEQEFGNKIDYVPGKNWCFNNYQQDKINPTDIYKICALNKDKNDFSIMKKLFTGTITTNFICKYCSSHAPTFENFLTLTLDIPIYKKKEIYTLNECFEHTFKDEILDKHNKMNCDFCGIKNKSTKQNKLWQTPTILIIHLKRFKMNQYGQHIAKITNQIIYPTKNLNLSQFFHEDSPFKNDANYNLIGVNIHHELLNNSIDVGHYVSIVKNRYDKKWYLFNDSNNPTLIKNKQHKSAYMLFYIKK